MLTGFSHNAVSPFGMLCKVPIVICSRCLDVSPSYIYLGGGLVDVKLGIALDEFIRAVDPIIGKVSEAR